MRQPIAARAWAQQPGFTLIELCVVLAIVAILYAQAAPSFSAWIHNAQVRTAAETLQNGLQLARAEAIRRNRSVIFWLTSANTPLAADFLVGCANPPNYPNSTQPEAAGDCPGTAVANGVPAFDGVHYNWISRQTATDLNLTTPQVSTPNGAIWVTFGSLGMVQANSNGDPSIAEIDVTDPTIPTSLARPLHVMVNGGQIWICDPALTGSGDPRGC